MIEYMRACTLGRQSRSNHLSSCTRFAAFLGRSPATATADDIRRFQLFLVESGVSIVHRNRIMTGVKFLLRVTLRRHDLAAEIHHLKEPRKVPLVLSRQEIKRLLAVAPGLKLRAMLSLACGRGLRAGEVVRLRVGDIDSAQNIIRIVQSKGRKDRNVMLPAEVIGLLRDWWTERPAHKDRGVPLPDRWLFPSRVGRDCLTTRQFARLFRAMVAAAGISKPVTLHSLPHSLRHSFATHILERGADIQVIQALLGHAKLTTTAGYARIATGIIADVASPLDDLTPRKRRKGKAGSSQPAALPRSSLEVADIFRDHGAAWRAANAGHVSLEQLKVMSAIEQCRTAAPGGHVARCEDCAHEHIAYNSCRNRHCPKCQAGAAKAWLAARGAELMPVGCFHLVFTVPAPIADIACQNKRAVYDLLMRASAETTLRIAADRRHLGGRIGITSVLHSWGSAITHHPHVHMIVPGGGLSADGERWVPCRKNFFLPVRVLSRLFRRLFLDGPREASRQWSPRLLRRACRSRRPHRLRRLPRTAANHRVGRLRQGTLRRAEGRARLSQPLHPPRRHPEQPPDPGRRR